MTDRAEIMQRLAESLKNTRTERGLSLDAISRLSGVSRSMVSQIERGESSPTVATLWNLTQALGVDFAGLIDAQTERPAISFLSSEDTPTIAKQAEGVTIRILSPPEETGRHEVYELSFQAGGSLDSAPHSAGTREHLTVFDGTLTVTSGDAEQSLSAGDTARYSADQPHAIRSGKRPARAFLVVTGSFATL